MSEQTLKSENPKIEADLLNQKRYTLFDRFIDSIKFILTSVSHLIGSAFRGDKKAFDYIRKDAAELAKKGENASLKAQKETMRKTEILTKQMEQEYHKEKPDNEIQKNNKDTIKDEDIKDKKIENEENEIKEEDVSLNKSQTKENISKDIIQDPFKVAKHKWINGQEKEGVLQKECNQLTPEYKEGLTLYISKITGMEPEFINIENTEDHKIQVSFKYIEKDNINWSPVTITSSANYEDRGIEKDLFSKDICKAVLQYTEMYARERAIDAGTVMSEEKIKTAILKLAEIKLEAGTEFTYKFNNETLTIGKENENQISIKLNDKEKTVIDIKDLTKNNLSAIVHETVKNTNRYKEYQDINLFNINKLIHQAHRNIQYLSIKEQSTLLTQYSKEYLTKELTDLIMDFRKDQEKSDKKVYKSKFIGNALVRITYRDDKTVILANEKACIGVLDDVVQNQTYDDKTQITTDALVAINATNKLVDQMIAASVLDEVEVNDLAMRNAINEEYKEINAQQHREDIQKASEKFDQYINHELDEAYNNSLSDREER